MSNASRSFASVMRPLALLLVVKETHVGARGRAANLVGAAFKLQAPNVPTGSVWLTEIIQLQHSLGRVFRQNARTRSPGLHTRHPSAAGIKFRPCHARGHSNGGCITTVQTHVQVTARIIQARGKRLRAECKRGTRSYRTVCNHTTNEHKIYDVAHIEYEQVRALLAGERCKLMKTAPLVGASFNTASG